MKIQTNLPFFSLVLLLFDPLDRFVASGVVQDLLDSIYCLNGQYEVTIVDNNVSGTTPHLIEYLDGISRTRKLRVLHAGRNLGVAGGYNAGIRQSNPGSDYFVLLSSDTQAVDPDTLLKMHRAISVAADIGLAQPMSVFEDVEYLNISAQFGLQAYRDYWRMRQGDSPILDLSRDEIGRMMAQAATRSGLTVPVNRFGFTFLMIKSKVWQSVGEFDESFQYCFENIDYLVRALKLGYKTAVVNDVFVNHRRPLVRVLCGKDSGEEAKDPLRGAYELSEKAWYRKWKNPPDAVCDRVLYGTLGYGLRRFYGWARSRLSRIKRYLTHGSRGA